MNILEKLWLKFKRGGSYEKLLFVNIAVYILVNIIKVFLVLMKVEDAGLYYPVNYLSLPADMNQIKFLPWTPLTYMFLHEDFLHILFNMLWFYWFGKIFIDYIGAKKLTGVYVIGGLFGALFYVSAFNIFPLFESVISIAKALGASASVIAIVVAISFYIPDHRVNLMFIGPVKLKYIALFTIVVDFLSIAGENSGGHIAHLGGAFFGFIYAVQLKNGKNALLWFEKLFAGLGKMLKPKPRMKATYTNTAKGKTDMDYNYEKAKQQKEIDAILDKIARSGYESLSKREKEILFNSSNHK